MALELEQYDEVWATFQPQRTDDLKPGSEAWIGRRLKWQALWRIESEYCEGAYTGQWAMGIQGKLEGENPPFVWVPESDLVAVSFLEDDAPMKSITFVAMGDAAIVGQEVKIESYPANNRIAVRVDGKDYYIDLRPVTGSATYRTTPVPKQIYQGGASATDGIPPSTPAAVNLLPAALTKEEMEALKPGERPTGYEATISSSCLDCRLTPPKGWRNESGTIFLCGTCYSKKVKR